MRIRYLSWQWFFVFSLMFLSVIALGVIAFGARQAQKLLEAEVNKHNRTLSFHIPGEVNSKISAWIEGTHQKLISALEKHNDFRSLGNQLTTDQSISAFFYIDLESSKATLMQSDSLLQFEIGIDNDELIHTKKHQKILQNFLQKYLTRESQKISNLPEFSGRIQTISDHSYQIHSKDTWRNLYINTVTRDGLKIGLIGILLDWDFMRRLLAVLVQKYPEVVIEIKGWGDPLYISYTGIRNLNFYESKLNSMSAIGPYPLSGYIKSVQIRIYYPQRWDFLGGPAFDSRYSRYFIERTKDMYELILAPLTLLLIGLLMLFFKLRKSAQRIRIQNDWIQNIAHDIQTPIHAMGSVLDILGESRETQNPQWNKFLRLELSRLHQTSRVFMQLARDDQASRKLHCTEFNFEKLIHRAIDTVKLMHMGRKPQINWDKNHGKLLIKADFNWLLDALINLLDNACKYSSGTPSIELKISLQGDKVKLKVSDQGYGIPDNEFKQVLQPFYRAQSSRTEGIHGNGLGLSIVQRVLIAHQGTVLIAANKPLGTVVVLEFPIKASA